MAHLFNNYSLQKLPLTYVKILLIIYLQVFIFLLYYRIEIYLHQRGKDIKMKFKKFEELSSKGKKIRIGAIVFIGLIGIGAISDVVQADPAPTDIASNDNNSSNNETTITPITKQEYLKILLIHYNNISTYFNAAVNDESKKEEWIKYQNDFNSQIDNIPEVKENLSDLQKELPNDLKKLVEACNNTLNGINDLKNLETYNTRVRIILSEINPNLLGPVERLQTTFADYDISINGSIFYLKKYDNLGSLKVLDHSSKQNCKKLAPFYDYLAKQGIDTICIWYETGFVDGYGNESIDTSYKINIPLNELMKVNWDNEYAIDIDTLAEDKYVHPSYYR